MTTKTYIITKDKVDNALSTTSENPVQNKVIKSAIDAKQDVAQAIGDIGKFAQVVTDGSSGAKIGYVALPQADWSQATETADDFIKNKPFKTIGAGCTVDADGKLNVDTQLHFEVFASLPAASATYKQTIALVKQPDPSTRYDEFACVKIGETWKWEQIGDTDISVEQTTTAIKIAGTTINTASSTQIGLLSSADWTTFNGKQDKLTFDDAPTASSTNPVKSGGVYTALEGKQAAALVTTFQATPDDTHYPSEKLVKDNIDTLSTAVGGKVPYAGSGMTFTLGLDANGLYYEN